MKARNPTAESRIPRVRATLAAASVFSAMARVGMAQDADPIPPLLPPYAELPPTFWEQHGLKLLLAGVAALLVTGFLLWLKLRPRRVTPLSPDARARQALAALEGKPETGALLSEVSHIVRHYFSAAFALPEGELTTTEFCRVIQETPAIEPDLTVAIADFLGECDRRKFAPAVSGDPIHAAKRAGELIERGEARRAAIATAAQTERKP